jgi:hypothetical protein
MILGQHPAGHWIDWCVVISENDCICRRPEIHHAGGSIARYSHDIRAAQDGIKLFPD